MESASAGEVIFTRKENCVGCNKCIRTCPVFGANVSFEENGTYKVRVDQEKCIRCGACVDACTHGARGFRDDTERFFADLEDRQAISVVMAPAFRVNFGDYRRFIGTLKGLGVNKAVDVSFGADITTWAYLKSIREKNLASVIAQPCPAVVNYVEKYRHDLVSRLAPVHSPTLCAAVYLKKYARCQDRIAFISPCIAKIDEFADPNTGGYVSYNVTYEGLRDWFERRGIDPSRSAPMDFDNPEAWLGAVYSRPGGLRENVEALAADAWVRQVEGPAHAYPYLEEYSDRVREGKPLPLLVDILNCTNGCNLGTATGKRVSIDDADLCLNCEKRERSAARGEAGASRQEELFAWFDAHLSLEDFARTYTSRPVTIRTPDADSLERIFGEMRKFSEEDRKIDCSACGYQTCREMAAAIFSGINARQNCIKFTQSEISVEAENIREKSGELDRLAGYTARVVSALDSMAALDFTAGIDGEFSGEFSRIRDSLQVILDVFNETLVEIKEATEQFDAGAAQISIASSALARGASDQSEAVKNLSGTVAGLGDQSRRNAENANKARGLTAESKRFADEGNDRMNSLLESMSEISESSGAISKILHTIEDIAFQTRILSLNAAVEAARAGKFGKGFSVVAEEVRNLANRCTQAARDSGELIGAAMDRISTGVGIADETAAVLRRIGSLSADIAGTVEGIAADSEGQTEGLRGIETHIYQVSQVVQDNSALSHQCAATSEELSAQATSLRTSVGRFKLREGRKRYSIEELERMIAALEEQGF